MGTVAGLWRHPIKSHGREEVTSVHLDAGRTMPGDRVWAVAHEVSKATDAEWSPCVAFSRGSKAPALQGIRTETLADGRLRLSHPDLGELTIDPDREASALIDWSRPLMPTDRAASARIVRVPDRGMTDTDYPSISLINLSSHRAVEQRHGRALSPLRWRGNVLIDGLGPWQEFEWIGRRLRLGSAVVEVRERTGRCNATRADPETGRIDADTLALLDEGWDHQDFGVYAVVVESGEVNRGDGLELIA